MVEKYPANIVGSTATYHLFKNSIKRQVIYNAVV